MTEMLDSLAALSPVEGADRVYYAGLKSQEAEARSAVKGVPLSDRTWEILAQTASEMQIALPEYRAE
jgi:LDH2 family malate/lactate/ureidoglycolate dehydrogenase